MESERLVRMEADVEYLKKRADKNDALSDKITELVLSISGVTGKLDRFVEASENFQKRTGERIEKLEGEPGKKWQTVTGQIIAIVVAAVLGGLLGRFF